MAKKTIPHTPTHPIVFQCPLCKDLTQLTQFATDTKGITIDCSHCKGQIFVPQSTRPTWVAGDPALSPGSSTQRQKTTPKAEPAPVVVSEPEEGAVVKEAEVSDAAVSEPVSVAEPEEAKVATDAQERCPKCGHLRVPEEDNCHKCGLAFANVGKTFDPERFSKPQSADEAQALKLWQGVVADWDNAAKHEVFIQYCNNQKLLELAAHHYRRLKDEDGARASLASEHLAKILELVQVQFLSEQARGNSRSSVQRGKWIMMAVVLVFAFFAFYIMIGKMSGNSPMQFQMP